MKPKLLFDSGNKFKTIALRLGDNYTMECPFENFVRFEWFKDTELFDSQLLTIDLKNVSLRDKGKFNITKLNQKI